MRAYVFTNKERKLLTEYLLTGETSDAFWVLMNRINKSNETLKADLDLIHKTLSKYNKKQTPS
jgi:hypothetical protein